MDLDRPAVRRDDLEPALAVRQELGPGSDDQAVAVFLERCERAIDERVDQRLRERGAVRSGAGPDDERLKLAVISIALGIPVTGAASAVGDAGAAVAIVAWIAIAIVNVAYARRA